MLEKSGILETSKDTIEILDIDSHGDKSDKIDNNSNDFKPNFVDFEDVVKVEHVSSKVVPAGFFLLLGCSKEWFKVFWVCLHREIFKFRG